MAGYDPLDREDVEEWEKGESTEDMNKIFQFFFHTGPSANKDSATKSANEKKRKMTDVEDDDDDEEFLRDIRRRKAEKEMRGEREKLIREDERRKIQAEWNKKVEYDRKKQEEDEKRLKAEERRRYQEEMKLKRDLEEQRRILELQRKQDDHKRKELDEQERKVREEKMNLMREQLAHEEKIINDLKRRHNSEQKDSRHRRPLHSEDYDEDGDIQFGEPLVVKIKKKTGKAKRAKKSRKKGRKIKRNSKASFGNDFQAAGSQFTKGTDGKWYEKQADGKWVVSEGPGSRRHQDSIMRENPNRSRDGMYQDSLGRIFDRIGNEYVMQPNGGLKRISNTQAHGGKGTFGKAQKSTAFVIDDDDDYEEDVMFTDGGNANSWGRDRARDQWQQPNAQSSTFKMGGQPGARRMDSRGDTLKTNSHFQSAQKLREDIMKQQEMIAQQLLRAQLDKSQQYNENRKRKTNWHEEL